MASKRKKGLGDEGAIIRRGKIAPAKLVQRTESERTYEAAVTGGLRNNTYRGVPGRSASETAYFAKAAPAEAAPAKAAPAEVAPAEAVPAGRAFGSQFHKAAKKELKEIGTLNFAIDGNKNTQKGYLVTVEDDRLIFEGDNGQTVIAAPGIKGGQKGYIQSSTGDLFKLMTDNAYSIESSDGRLRFKEQSSGRSRDNFSIALINSRVDREYLNRKETPEESRNQVRVDYYKAEKLLKKREQEVTDERENRGHVTKATIRARDSVARKMDDLAARYNTLNS